MTIAERLPSLDDAALASLRVNALRLEAGDGSQKARAAELLPLIEAEMAERQSRKPVKVTKAKAAKAAKVAAADGEEPVAKATRGRPRKAAAAAA